MTITLTHPLPGSTPTGGFRWRDAFTENGVYVPAMLHNGQDYGANAGTPILAAHDGKVIWAGWDRDGGNGIQIQHPDGWSTLYFHMNAPTWRKVGERMVGGKSIIGHVGMSGLATGNHLHFMLRENGKDLDPVPYITGAAPKPSTPDSSKTSGALLVRRKRRRNNMLIFVYLHHGAGKGQHQFAIYEHGKPGTWWEFNGQSPANQLATQLGAAMGLSKNTWNERKAKHS